MQSVFTSEFPHHSITEATENTPEPLWALYPVSATSVRNPFPQLMAPGKVLEIQVRPAYRAAQAGATLTAPHPPIAVAVPLD